MRIFVSLLGVALLASVLPGCGGSFCPPDEAEIVFGDVLIENSVDLESLAKRGCFQIRGNLEVRGTNLTSLEPLGKLTEVSGELLLSDNPNLESLGLRQLREVGDRLALWNLALVDLDDLHQLRRVGALSIDQMPALGSIDGLRTLSGSIRNLMITDAPSLHETTGLEGIERIGESLWLRDTAIDDLRGLRALTTVVQELHIVRTGVTSLNGLDALESVHQGIEIGENQALIRLDAITRFGGSTGELLIHGNPLLSSLTGPTKLLQIRENLGISSNPLLADLAGLDSVTTVGGSVTIRQNPTLPQSVVDAFVARADIGGAVAADGNGPG